MDSLPSSPSGATGTSQSANMKPVFVFPGSLDFYFDDQTTYKRAMTLYNPFEIDMTFKVLCNNPKKYAVVEPEGRIPALKCTDIIVRHVAISPASVQQTDKFRIHVFEDGSSEVCGRRDILATLHPGVPESVDKHSMSLPQRGTSADHMSQPGGHERGATSSLPYQGFPGIPDHHPQHNNHQQQQPNYVAIVAALVCIAALFLPTEGEQTLADYPYLQLTVNQKLVFAYVLGLVTISILKTS